MGRSDSLAKKLFGKLITLRSDPLVTSKAVFFKWRMMIWKDTGCHSEESHLRELPGPASENDMHMQSIFVGLSF